MGDKRIDLVREHIMERLESYKKELEVELQIEIINDFLILVTSEFAGEKTASLIDIRDFA